MYYSNRKMKLLLTTVHQVQTQERRKHPGKPDTKIECLGCKCHHIIADVESTPRTGRTWRGSLLHIQFYQK